LSGEHLLEKIGKKRGHLRAGGIVDVERTAILVVDEFRSAKIGRLSLEAPEEMAVEKEEREDKNAKTES
jgi:ribosome biogenesis GTPase A